MAKALFLEDLPIIGKYIRDLLANKVDKVEGKNLSTNDYTTEEKTKLEALSNDYDDLTNKPSINGVTLSGNKTTEDLIPIGDGLDFNADGELEATGGSDVLVIEAVIYNETPELYSIRFEKSLTEIVSDIKGVNGNAIVKIWTTSRKLKCYLSETFNGDGSGNWVTNVRRYSDNYDTVCRDVLMIGNSSDNRNSVWKYPLQKNLTFDSTPTQNSSNPVTSGGIYNALQNAGTSDYPDLTNKPSINDVTLEGNKTSAELGLMPEQEVDTTPTESSENLITSGAVWSADKNIKDKLQGSKTASTSGGTIEIPDYGMTESIQMYFKPTQDLHGYDKPWAGGAGKNKFNPANYAQDSFDGTTYTDVAGDGAVSQQITLPAGTYTFSVKLLSLPSADRTLVFTPTLYGDNLWSLSHLEVKDVGEVYQGTVTLESDTSFYAYLYGTGGGTFKIQIQIELGQTATTFAPYSNICPISGQDNATFEWTGKNLFDGEYPDISAGVKYKAIYVGDGTFTMSTTMPQTPTTATNLFFLTGNVSSGASTDTNGVSQYVSRTITSTNGYVTVGYRNSEGVYPSNYRTQIEKGSTATSYKRYIHEELSLNFGKTCYGGFCTFDGNVYSTWSYTASYNGETLSGKWVSDRDEYRIGRTPTIGAEVAYEIPQSTDYFRVTPPANLSLTDDYPIEYNGWMASINYQPKGTVLVEAKKYTNQEIFPINTRVQILENGGDRSLNYSTTEQVVGTWIDGKPLYQRTIYTTNATTRAWTDLEDFSSADIDEVVEYNGNYSRITADTIVYNFDVHQYNTSPAIGGILRYIGNKLQYYIDQPTDQLVGRIIVTIRYTKTTD